jgi:prolyl-tRNA editing enzyme YbaK/EbsC (Cys-tRNA(Pro) deacylase)
VTAPTLGTLDWQPATEHPDLLAPTVPAALAGLDARVAEIDPELADTAAFCERYEVPAAASANCVVLVGKREGREVWAAAVVLATSRADVNGVIRKHLDVRKISFAPMATAVERTGMEYGGITPAGLPPEWPVLVDRAVVDAGPVVIGSGLRRSKVLLEGTAVAALPTVTVLDGMANPVG